MTRTQTLHSMVAHPGFPMRLASLHRDATLANDHSTRVMVATALRVLRIDRKHPALLDCAAWILGHPEYETQGWMGGAS
jgi:hypothetical protein